MLVVGIGCGGGGIYFGFGIDAVAVRDLYWML